MSTKAERGNSPTLKLALTEQQREELVRFIAETGQTSLNIDIAFEANVPSKTIAPVAVLVGNAI
ncbi:hypothetical protein [Trinickia sp.]|uniref:hypothetical protein n=1 Tax=Trinickia sp. TaxID=2571163 RepID=UPI003F81D220